MAGKVEGCQELLGEAVNKSALECKEAIVKSAT